MKHRLINWSAVLLIIVGVLVSIQSQTCQATTIHALSEESSNQITLGPEQREQLLAEYSQNESLPIAQRAAATVSLGQYYGPNSIIAVARASRSEYPQLRLAAIQAAGQWRGRAKWDLISPMLDDVDRAVEAQAVRTLIELWPQLSGEYLDRLEPAVDRHLALLSDDLDGDMERAWIYTIKGDFEQAELIYLDRFENHKEPRVAIAYAEYLKGIDDDEQAQHVLTQTLVEFPESAALHYSLGLSYLRTGERVKALLSLRNAYDLSPTNGSYGYTYATLARENDAETAIAVYQAIYQNHAQPAYLYALCDTLLNAGQDANKCLVELESVAPQDVVSKLKKLYLPN
ncbi:TPR_REGION domain-containing protein [Vibrio chagasii]|nr:TPR_REGION domain-containing protein [Vibrio chagasii]